MVEMDKLERYLIEHHYIYKRHRWMGGDQIIVYDGYCSDDTILWDAIYNPYSYGYNEGLLEIYGSIVPGGKHEVLGHLTAAEVIKYIEEAK